jgi:uncharacterized ferredoxin-like protein
MARIDGKEAARDMVVEVAKLAAAAAYRTPQLTAKLELKTEIVTGKDLLPIIEFFEAIHPIAPVMYFDYKSLKYFIDSGYAPTVLLLGAELTRSELGWDCGACGFETCAEFNAYSKKHKSRSMLASGPSCIWKVLDFGAACDFACAAVAQHRLECRAMGTLGVAAAGVGFLPDCSMCTGIPIGPPGDFVYFSRSQNVDTASYETHREWLLRTSPTNWLAFPGSTRPSIKTKQDWWNNMEYIKWEPMSEQEQKYTAEHMENVAKVVQKNIPKVTAWYNKNE